MSCYHIEAIRDNLSFRIQRFKKYFEKPDCFIDLKQITHIRAKLEEIYPNIVEAQNKIDGISKHIDEYWQKRIDDIYFECYAASFKAEKEFLKKQNSVPPKGTPSVAPHESSKKEVLKEPTLPAQPSTQTSANTSSKTQESSEKEVLIEPSTTTQSSAEITIDLPKFNGGYNTWRYFYHTFKSMIHDNEKVLQVNKFQHLRSCLNGEALTIIEYLSPNDYPTAWETLVKKYEKPRLIVDAHLKELLGLPKLKNGSPPEIRKLANDAQKHMIALRAMNHPTDEYLFVFLIASKLDKVTRLQWELSSGDTKMPAWTDFMEFLDKYSQEYESKSATSVNKQVISRPAIF